jgi:hypothetical protein
MTLPRNANSPAPDSKGRCHLFEQVIAIAQSRPHQVCERFLGRRLLGRIEQRLQGFLQRPFTDPGGCWENLQI